MLIAVLVELSAWSEAVNLIAAGALIFFFVGAVGGYLFHGIRGQIVDQFADPYPDAAFVHLWMVALIVAGIGGFAVLLAGFVDARFA